MGGGASNQSKQQQQQQQQAQPVVVQKNNYSQDALQDIILELKMSIKKCLQDSKRAEKEKQQQLKKAENAIKTNNEEGARSFAENALMKDREMVSLQKQAQKLDAIIFKIKNNQNQKDMTNKIARLSDILKKQDVVDSDSVYKQLEEFDKQMVDMTVAVNTQNNILYQNDGNQINNTQIDQILNNIKVDQAANIAIQLQQPSHQIGFQSPVQQQMQPQGLQQFNQQGYQQGQQQVYQQGQPQVYQQIQIQGNQQGQQQGQYQFLPQGQYQRYPQQGK